MTVVVHCLRVWMNYLLGQHFTIYTDNVATNGRIFWQSTTSHSNINQNGLMWSSMH
ncbi:unnamed protein product [Spirodela intermedia]|uniref:Uncharacterized protein n=1 Tax=Spirodela intermedia TaxID=51605 RepID=A0A7I8JK56_SPIIN|nr:unnamed protein product [Spirodela intermedia]CAA6670241.1 unnamed protein product [Spirodela intermedia]